jgi:probable rRNA maturation factor
VQYATEITSRPDRKLITDCVRQAFRTARPDDRSSFETVVRIVGEDESRSLNNQFRHIDKPTNVLAFPAQDGDAPESFDVAGKCYLGDLVICAPLVIREAAEQSKKPEDHWAHLLVHGTLHLLGYDHVSERGADEMEEIECRVLAARGIDDPYRAG